MLYTLTNVRLRCVSLKNFQVLNQITYSAFLLPQFLARIVPRNGLFLHKRHANFSSSTERSPRRSFPKTLRQKQVRNVSKGTGKPTEYTKLRPRSEWASILRSQVRSIGIRGASSVARKSLIHSAGRSLGMNHEP